MMDLTSDCFDFNSLEFQIFARERLNQIDQEVVTILSPQSEVQQCANLTDTSTELSPNNRDYLGRINKMEDEDDATMVSEGLLEQGASQKIQVSNLDQISAIIQIVIQSSKGRSEIRLDQISKQIVRKQFKSKKHQFMAHLTYLGHTQLPHWRETQALLLNFLSEKYGISSVLFTYPQVLIAKSIFYNFTARRNDETLGTTEKKRIAYSRVKFCERGTKQEALKFFKSKIAFKVIYSGFYGSLKELTQREMPVSIQRQMKLIERYLEQLEDVQHRT